MNTLNMSTSDRSERVNFVEEELRRLVLYFKESGVNLTNDMVCEVIDSLSKTINAGYEQGYRKGYEQGYNTGIDDGSLFAGN